MRVKLSALWLIAVVVGVAVAPVSAEVVRIEVHVARRSRRRAAVRRRRRLRKIAGKIFFAVDPALPANRIVADIDQAPRNASRQGRVLLRLLPDQAEADIAEAATAPSLYEVSNRGGKGMLGFFNHAAGSADPTTPADMGDGFLMAQGFTLLVGRVAVRPAAAARAGARLPADRRPTTGSRSAAWCAATSSSPRRNSITRSPIAITRPTPSSIPRSPDNVLTVRDYGRGAAADRAAQTSGASRARRRHARRRSDARLHGGEVRAEQDLRSRLHGARTRRSSASGPAAIRDVVSMLKHQSADALVDSRPARSRARSAFGISQSGRFLRTYLYYGFNRDEGNRKVFDGVIAHVAGAGRGSFNHRFAQPSRDGHPYHQLLLSDRHLPVHRRRRRSDPETGVTDGLLTHAGSPELLPKIFYTNSEYEYWGRAASLIHTTVDGKADAPLMDNVRIYLLSAGQHGPGGVSADADDRPAAQQPARLPLGDEGAARRDGSLDRANGVGAAAEPLSAHRRRHARARPTS